MSDNPTISTQAAEGQEYLQWNPENRRIRLITIGGAVGTGFFMGSGKTVHLTGPLLPLIYPLTGTMLFFVIRVMDKLLLHDLEYEFFQDLARDILGPWARYFAGWTHWILWVVTANTEVVVIAGYFDFWIKDMTWSMICTFILLMALLGCNLLTVKLSDEIEFWSALVKIIAILFLIVVDMGIILVNFQSVSIIHLQGVHDPLGIFPTNGDSFLAALQTAMFAFIGIKSIGTTAAETSDLYKTLPKAINAISVRVVIFYVLALAVIMSVIPWDKIDPDIPPSVNLFSMVGSAAAAGAINFVVLTSASSGASSRIFSASHMLYGLSQSKQTPKSFGHLSKHQVPAKVPILSVTLTCVAFPILVTGGLAMEAFTMISSVLVELMLFVWSLILVCYIHYRRLYPEAHKNAAFRMPGAASMPWVVLGLFGFVVCMLLCYDDTRIALGLTLLWFTGLAISWFAREKVHRGVSR